MKLFHNYMTSTHVIFTHRLELLLFSLYLLLFSITAQANADPVWMGNEIGKDDIVLPGYDSIEKYKNGIQLGKRYYDFSGNNYINKISVGDKDIVSNIYLEFIINGVSHKGIKQSIDFKEVTATHAIITNNIKINSDIDVTITSRLEYDGVVMADINVVSTGDTKVDGINLVSIVNKNKNSIAMSYKTKGIRKQKHRNDILKIPYAGEFLNVVSISNGMNSFWWFADNAKGWIWNSRDVTSVDEVDNTYVLKQKIIGSSYVLPKEYKVNFNYLVTPVKEIDTSFRSKRIMWGMPSQQQKEIKSTYKIWWTNAFAYDAFPYTEYPGNTKSALTKQDLKAYKGRSNNRQLILKDRLNWGVSWIPYFSAHVLSELDPVLTRYKNQWQLIPKKTFKDGLHPYSNNYDKPVLSHNAKGYSDYVLWRISDEIDNLGMDGIYLDHGPPHDSKNLLNGGWYDSNGKLQPSLDILALRSFLKRLKTLFYTKNKPGYVFVHHSNREIIPAYTFAFGTIDGEQYRRSLKNGDYLKILSVDEFRARFSNQQYGIINYWLPVEWTNHKKGDGWINSEAQKMAYRKSMALALLHDVPVWPQGVHLQEQKKVLNVIDNFGIENSVFSGYWSDDTGLKCEQDNILISEYISQDASLFVVTNISDDLLEANLEYKSHKKLSMPIYLDEGLNYLERLNHIKAKILPGDFKLIILANPD